MQEASRHLDHLLRRRPAHLRGRCSHTPSDRQQAHGLACRARQRTERSLRDALAETVGDPAGLVASGKTEALALSGRCSRASTSAATRLSKLCQKARRICKIPKPITPHSMRHAFAVHLLESGTDVRTIQLLLGHRSLATTAKYLRIATSKVCSTSSPLDLLPRPVSLEAKPTPPQHF